MKRASILGLFVLISLLVIIGYVAINTRIIEKYIKGTPGRVIIEPVSITIESIRELYTTFQQTIDMVMNPWKYMYEVEEAKPSDDVIREQYGVSIGPLSQLSYAVFKCKDITCSDVTIPNVYLISYINYNFLDKRKIEFSCDISTTYDECFSKSCELSKKTVEGKRGIIVQQVKVSLKFNKNNPKCHDCSSSDPNECIKKPVIFKDYGFRTMVTLKANFNVEANTTFRALVTTDTILTEAISRKKSIYDILNIDPAKYDVAYYTGLLGFPHVDISRLGKKHNYPIILFGENTESYDVLLFGVRELENIKSINDLKLQIYVSAGIDLGCLSLDGECKNNCQYNIEFDSSETLLSIRCIEQRSSPEGEEHLCHITITKEFLDIYRRIYGDTLKFMIPICLKKKETFVGDYGELLVQAYINYTYETAVSYEIPYTSFDAKI